MTTHCKEALGLVALASASSEHINQATCAKDLLAPSARFFGTTVSNEVENKLKIQKKSFTIYICLTNKCVI